MKYTKEPLPIPDQIKRLQSRGLIIDDEELATFSLARISFYRLRAYTYPFQDNASENHPFIAPVSFSQIIRLYEFDSRLRLLLFEAIEKIEIAFRTQLIYCFSLSYGSHWHLNPNLYRDISRFANHIDSLQQEVDRSIETFIDHYKGKYTDPPQPPSWMGLEVSSLGLLSKLYQNLKKTTEKKAVAEFFGLQNIFIFENWMHCLSIIRNICAHHGRIWNRRYTPIKIPTNTIYPFVADLRFENNKLYASIVCMAYLMKIIAPENGFRSRLVKLLSTDFVGTTGEMGFTDNWNEDNFWKK